MSDNRTVKKVFLGKAEEGEKKEDKNYTVLRKI